MTQPNRMWEEKINVLVFELSSPELPQDQYSKKREELKSFISSLIQGEQEKLLKQIENNKAITRRTPRGAWIVNYGKEHAVFGELKRAKEYKNGYNQALYYMKESIEKN